MANLTGTLIDYGKAPYQNNPQNKESFYVDVKNAQGEIQQRWGLDFAELVEKHNIQKGDMVNFVDLGKDETTNRHKWDYEPYEPLNPNLNSIELDDGREQNQPQTAQENTAETNQQAQSNKQTLDEKIPSSIALNYVAIKRNRLLADEKINYYEKSDTSQVNIAFEDHKSSLHTSRQDEKTVNAMLDLAESKGWTSIKLKGTEEFKQKAWLEASLRGISINGYTPSERDLAELKAKQEQRTVNHIEAEDVKATHIEKQQEIEHQTPTAPQTVQQVDMSESSKEPNIETTDNHATNDLFQSVQQIDMDIPAYHTKDYHEQDQKYLEKIGADFKGATVERQAESFDDVKQQAKAFTGQELTNFHSGIKAVISNNSLSKMLSGKANEKSVDLKTHLIAVANADKLFENAIFGWNHEHKGADKNLDIGSIHRAIAPLNINDEIYLAKLTIKEFAYDGNRVYSIEAVELDNEKSPIPEMVANDLEYKAKTDRHNGALIDIIVKNAQNFNRENEKNHKLEHLESTTLEMIKSLDVETVKSLSEQDFKTRLNWIEKPLEDSNFLVFQALRTGNEAWIEESKQIADLNEQAILPIDVVNRRYDLSEEMRVYLESHKNVEISPEPSIVENSTQTQVDKQGFNVNNEVDKAQHIVNMQVEEQKGLQVMQFAFANIANKDDFIEMYQNNVAELHANREIGDITANHYFNAINKVIDSELYSQLTNEQNADISERLNTLNHENLQLGTGVPYTKNLIESTYNMMKNTEKSVKEIDVNNEVDKAQHIINMQVEEQKGLLVMQFAFANIANKDDFIEMYQNNVAELHANREIGDITANHYFNAINKVIDSELYSQLTNEQNADISERLNTLNHENLQLGTGVPYTKNLIESTYNMMKNTEKSVKAENISEQHYVDILEQSIEKNKEQLSEHTDKPLNTEINHDSQAQDTIKAQLIALIQTGYKNGEFKSRDDVINKVVEAGYTITNQRADGFSVENPNNKEHKIALTGDLVRENFHESIANIQALKQQLKPENLQQKYPDISESKLTMINTALYQIDKPEYKINANGELTPEKFEKILTEFSQNVDNLAQGKINEIALPTEAPEISIQSPSQGSPDRNR